MLFGEELPVAHSKVLPNNFRYTWEEIRRKYRSGWKISSSVLETGISRQNLHIQTVAFSDSYEANSIAWS